MAIGIINRKNWWVKPTRGDNAEWIEIFIVSVFINLRNLLAIYYRAARWTRVNSQQTINQTWNNYDCWPIDLAFCHAIRKIICFDVKPDAIMRDRFRRPPRCFTTSADHPSVLSTCLTTGLMYRGDTTRRLNYTMRKHFAWYTTRAAMYREDPAIFAYYDDRFSGHEYLRHDFRRSWRSEFEERDAASHAGDIFNRPDAPTRKNTFLARWKRQSDAHLCLT